MAHFAELDEKNYVVRVIVVDNDNTLDENGNESEEKGIEFCKNLLGGRWKQTSYSAHPFDPNSFRGKFAGIGDYYDEELDRFV